MPGSHLHADSGGEAGDADPCLCFHSQWQREQNPFHVPIQPESKPTPSQTLFSQGDIPSVMGWLWLNLQAEIYT